MRLRHVATVGPAVPGLSRHDRGKTVSFLPLERIWSDERFDPSQTIEFTGDIESYNAVAEGDLLVPKVSPTFTHGRVALAERLVNEVALATSEVFVVRARTRDEARFVKYRLLASDFRQEGEASWTGVAGLKRISADFLRDVRIDPAVWNRCGAIADFLEREDARLRALTEEVAAFAAAEAEMLASIRERLLAVEAPTVRLKFLLDDLVDTEHATCPRVDGGAYTVIRTTGVRGGVLDEHGCYSTDEEHYRQWTRRRVPRAGDVVLTREAPAGEAAVIPSDGRWCLGQRTVLLVPRKDVLPEYLVMALHGRRVCDEIGLRSRSTTAAHLNVGEIGELRLPAPSVDQQRALVREFATAQARVQSLDEELTALREELAAYRDALITEAVTGALDVTALGDARVAGRLEALREGEREVVA